MRIKGKEIFLPSILRRVPSARRRGQTVVEYLLVTVSLVIAFSMMYQALQSSMANYFQRGGLVIIRPYIETRN